MNNVKFSIYSLATDDTYGVQTLVTDTSGLEGYLEEVSDRVLGQLSGPGVSQKMFPQFKLLYKPNPIYLEADRTYRDNYSNLENGSLIKFTHYKHPKLKIWVAYSTITKIYIVTSIRDGDHFGNAKIATLKEHETG